MHALHACVQRCRGSLAPPEQMHAKDPGAQPMQSATKPSTLFSRHLAERLGEACSAEPAMGRKGRPPHTRECARAHLVCAGQPGCLQLACCIDAGVMGPGGKPLPVALSRAEGTGQATTTAGLEPIARNPSRRSAWVPHSLPFHPFPLPLPSLAHVLPRTCLPSISPRHTHTTAFDQCLRG